MSGSDYLKCERCGERLCYDGDNDIRYRLEYQPIFCEKCFVKLEKKIEVLQKHDRRKH